VNDEFGRGRFLAAEAGMGVDEIIPLFKAFVFGFSSRGIFFIFDAAAADDEAELLLDLVFAEQVGAGAEAQGDQNRPEVMF